ncbi:saccharopine dehydrogenase NADP-binding domain-containing protein [Cyanobium sp. N.Huapi 1H5]|uniref:saccharopine dehydrogenase family protein n=1 Tax=Cyanobium sp. N.Huapi 1H5 TaxID=2823719 RepID=UPI0020CC46FC|nr:saccharopine dehydrogenase NADP-binding domain-containing protein [Cyanobium sp. N.Huapi 1H5]MCP9835972.1 saccharopine dehydrogenase NADP-binding domain-containing protein [Cyanobium sp. N.Huapi 1H5]
MPDASGNGVLPSSGRVLLYGATGFSGRLLTRCLVEQGIDVVLAGRNEDRLAAMARRWNLDFRVFPLGDPARIEASLDTIHVVLHAAGPFQRTALPMIAACIRTGTHYLDLAGEWPVFQLAVDQGKQAADNGVMLMPGIGFSIVASDCLLAMARARFPEAVALRLALSAPDVMSRGTFRSLMGLTSSTVTVRRNGTPTTLPAGSLSRCFDFGAGLRKAVAVNWPDVFISQVTDGIATVEVYAQADWPVQIAYRAGSSMAPLHQSAMGQRLLDLLSQGWPEAPSAAQRQRSGFTLVVEAEDRWRRCRCLRIQTPDGYTVTGATATAIVGRVLKGQVAPGFQSPAHLYGGPLLEESGCVLRVG